MKKILLFVAFLLGFTATQAQDAECTRHAYGESQYYSTKVDININGLATTQEGKAIKLCFSGDTIFFHNPFFSQEPVSAIPSLIYGIKDETGLITIPLHQHVYDYIVPEDSTVRSWYIGLVRFDEKDEYGNPIQEIIEGRESYLMQMDLETGVITSLEEGLFLCEYELMADGRKFYQYTFGANYTMTPYEPDPIVIPETATQEKYIYSYVLDSDTLVKVVDIAFDGADVYISDIFVDGSWVKGTLSGSRITLPTRQHLGILDDNFVEFVAGEYQGVNPQTGAEIYDNADNIQLSMSDDKKQLTNRDNDLVAMLVTGTLVLKVHKNPGFLYFNEVPATPAAPIFIQANVDPRWAGIEFEIPTKDVDGNFINPALITFSIFLDDELYEFIPGIYNVEAPLSEFPYGYCDMLGTDLYADNGMHRVFIYGELFEVIGVEVYYTVDGDRRTSERLEYSFGDSGVEQQVASSKVAVESRYIDLGGRSVEEPQNGIYIKATKYDDGSVVYSKQLVRKY